MSDQKMANHKAPQYYFFIRGLIRSQFHWYQFPAHFDRIAQQYNLQATTVFLDVAGNGKRFQQATPFSIEEMATDISQQIQDYSDTHSISPDSELHLIGISMGGMIAAELAANITNDFASIHIINSSFANLSAFWQRMRLPALLEIAPKLWHLEKREHTILKWTSNNPESTDLTNDWVQESNRHPLSLRNGLAQLWAASRYVVRQQAHKKRYVYCSQADRLVSWKCSEKLANYWQCPLERESTAGHDLPLDNPDWLAEKIIQRSQESSQ